MVSDGLLREFSQLLLKHSISLEDIMGMVYSKDELDPLTGKYKKYFDLTIVNRDSVKYPEGFTYKVRYKIDLSGNRIPQGKATYTTKTAAIDEAVRLGFDNRLEVLKVYELNKDKPKGGSVFYKMLTDYYTDGSKYLQDDTVNNKREVVHKSRKEARSFINNDLIPYLREKKIESIDGITTPIFSGFKLYLQKKGIKDKTINNRLNYIIRILEYHSRNGLLAKLPYTKGTALLRLNGKQEKEDAEILPIEKLKGIFPVQKLIDLTIQQTIMNINSGMTFDPEGFSKPIKEDQKILFSGYFLPLTLCILGLNTGMRNSEIARIKREDFIGVPEKETFLLKIWNKKTEYFNKTNESNYRKIPLHPYTIEAVKTYIRKREELFGALGDADFLFGNTVKDKDTGEADGFLHSKSFDKAVLLTLCLIKYKDNYFGYFNILYRLLKKGNIKALQDTVKDIKNAGKGITYYSFRKTFRTMLGLNNDLAEYYMGHKLGDNAKTTYIQVNRLDNKLFVEEYAEPVISMLDKYVFYSEEEINEIIDRTNEENEKKIKDKMDFYQSRKDKGTSKPEIDEEFQFDEAVEYMRSLSNDDDNSNTPTNNGYYSKM
jgi:integrase